MVTLGYYQSTQHQVGIETDAHLGFLTFTHPSTPFVFVDENLPNIVNVSCLKRDFVAFAFSQPTLSLPGDLLAGNVTVLISSAFQSCAYEDSGKILGGKRVLQGIPFISPDNRTWVFASRVLNSVMTIGYEFQLSTKDIVQVTPDTTGAVNVRDISWTGTIDKTVKIPVYTTSSDGTSAQVDILFGLTTSEVSFDLGLKISGCLFFTASLQPCMFNGTKYTTVFGFETWSSYNFSLNPSLGFGGALDVTEQLLDLNFAIPYLGFSIPDILTVGFAFAFQPTVDASVSAGVSLGGQFNFTQSLSNSTTYYCLEGNTSNEFHVPGPIPSTTQSISPFYSADVALTAVLEVPIIIILTVDSAIVSDILTCLCLSFFKGSFNLGVGVEADLTFILELAINDGISYCVKKSSIEAGSEIDFDVKLTAKVYYISTTKSETDLLSYSYPFYSAKLWQYCFTDDPSSPLNNVSLPSI
ncbi:hypothetical protein HDU84_008294 [Entophlyctis sp. JEL0112]|nr:hypothetical protein HDU84_008294 [Entophlyctis sp. JEL0112]